ncbi:MAG: hypothetical protein JSR45_10045 [Proteobacteria bacterium]|nr:hypothetical protein [Pseudomonadota bacterium]
MADLEIPLRITLIAPPKDVLFSLQHAKEGMVSAVRSDGSDLSLDLAVRMAEGPNGLRWLGPLIRPEGQRRFVYVASGACAGDPGAQDGRRAKVWLDALSAETAREAATTGRRAEARIPGTDKRGGAVCASTHPIDGWRLI